MIERRKYKRYSLTKEAFVKHANSLGRIVDLSLGGMLCECTVSNGLSPDSDGLGICYGNDRCEMGKIKVRRIIEKVREIPGADSPLLTRKCGIQFEDLSPTQRTQLKKIISGYKTS